MFGVRPNSREHDDQRAVEHAAVGEVGDEAGERPVELAELLDVEVEVLVVRVVVRVRHLHERDALLQQPPGSRQCRPKSYLP